MKKVRNILLAALLASCTACGTTLPGVVVHEVPVPVYQTTAAPISVELTDTLDVGANPHVPQTYTLTREGIVRFPAQVTSYLAPYAQGDSAVLTLGGTTCGYQRSAAGNAHLSRWGCWGSGNADGLISLVAGDSISFYVESGSVAVTAQVTVE